MDNFTSMDNLSLELESPVIEIPNTSYTQISCLVGWLTMVSCFLGIFSNIMSIFVFAQPALRRAPINILLLGMSSIDLTLCTLALFVFVVPELYACYRYPWLLFLQSYSLVYIYPLTSLTQTANIWLFLVVSYERWSVICGKAGQQYRHVPRSAIASVKNINARHRRHAIAAVLIVVFLSLAYNFVRFFEYKIVTKYVPEFDMLVDSVDDYLKNEDENSNYALYMDVYYIALFLLTHFAGPFFVLIIVNGTILRKIYVARRRRHQLITRRERTEHRTALMMAIVMLMFFVCHTGPFILNIIESINPKWFFGDSVALAFALNDISNFIVVTNAATTALIYYYFNPAYHEMCARICFQPFSVYQEPRGDGCHNGMRVDDTADDTVEML